MQIPDDTSFVQHVPRSIIPQFAALVEIVSWIVQHFDSAPRNSHQIAQMVAQREGDAMPIPIITDFVVLQQILVKAQCYQGSGAPFEGTEQRLRQMRIVKIQAFGALNR